MKALQRGSVTALVRMFPDDFREANEAELSHDIAAALDGATPLAYCREMIALVTSAAALRGKRFRLAPSLLSSVVWTVGLLFGASAALVVQNTLLGRPSTPAVGLVVTATLAVVLMSLGRSAPGGLRCAQVVAVAAAVFALIVGDETPLPILATAVMFVGVAEWTRRNLAANASPSAAASPATAPPATAPPPTASPWLYLSLLLGAVIALAPRMGGMYALMVLGSLVLAVWNPRPVVVMAAVPWFVGIGPSVIVATIDRATTGNGSATDLAGMVAVALLAATWVARRSRRIQQRI
jgi:hypothetical protein